MGVTRKHINKIDQINLDDWMSSLGFTYPKSEVQLSRFNKFYDDYKYKLINPKVDYEAIFNRSLKHKSKVVPFAKDESEGEIDELRMVARKGQTNKLPQHIVDKMRKKHNKPKDE